MGMYQYPRDYKIHKTQTYSYKNNGNIQLSPHFTLKEFRSKGNDGADEVVICPYLINNGLEKLFEWLPNVKAINITSGYRSIAHSKAIGASGAKDNHHIGIAADIKVKKNDNTFYKPAEVACALQDNGWEGGIGLMRTALHIDAGSKYYFDETKKTGGAYTVVADWHSYTGITTNYSKTNQITKETNKSSTTNSAQHKYKIGDNVIFSTCYKSSMAPNNEAIAANKMSKNHGVITKIAVGKNPYLLDNGLCWVNDGDIRGYYNASAQPSQATHKGTPYILTVDFLNIRAINNKNSLKVGRINRGEKFYVTRWKGKWAQLENGRWVCALGYCRKA